MKYKENSTNKDQLSILGFGCMRFPRTLGRIDIDKTESLIMEAFHQGVNYFDTAYRYPGCQETLGKILSKNKIRPSIYIAAKLPQSSCKEKGDFDRYFNAERVRLQTDYIDYYLMHNMISLKEWENLVELGIIEWIDQKKKKGEIRQIGFSFHGTYDEFIKIVDAYSWDFVQIQYNYINEHYQAGYDGLIYARRKNLLIVIMEPLLGGKLATGLPSEALTSLKKINNNKTPADWAFSWLWNQEEVGVVLSGMNSMDVVNENCRLASQAYSGMMTKEETQGIRKTIDIFNQKYKVSCTGCNYCMPCPKKINIPASFSAYNASYVNGIRTGIKLYFLSVGGLSKEPHYVDDCISCHQCEKKCPQNIRISQELKKVSHRLQWPGMKTVSKLVQRL